MCYQARPYSIQPDGKLVSSVRPYGTHGTQCETLFNAVRVTLGDGTIWSWPQL